MTHVMFTQSTLKLPGYPNRTLLKLCDISKISHWPAWTSLRIVVFSVNERFPEHRIYSLQVSSK